MYMPAFAKSTIISMVTFVTLYGDCFDNDNCETSVRAYDDHYAVPPPQYPSDSCAMIFFINAAYTFWQPYQQGMFLLRTLTKNPNTTAAANWIGTYMTPQSGFKVGAGINTFHDGWKVEAEYTWFSNDPAMRSTALDTINYNYDTVWDVDNSQVKTIASQFTNLFQRVDLTLDRTFYAGNYLAFCPMGGLVGAWEEQNLNIQLTYLNVPPADKTSGIHNVYQAMNWWCIGTYAALDSSYYCFDEWAIFFMAGGSINLAVHHTSYDINTSTVTTPPTITYSTKTKIPSVEPMLETVIGLRWDTFGMDWGLRVQIGWELQVWFNHNAFIQHEAVYANYGNYGNYAMQGLTANFRANF